MAYRKKLIEVALPLEAINRESAREKSIRHGHPSTLHLWWSRKPLATCRAVLFASLVNDPSGHPGEFPTEQDQEKERQRLFWIISDLVKWENINNEQVLGAAWAEIMKSTNGNPPPVLDPFCGGGSIPLEAQRLGLEAHGSDFNPVAVLITKALIEIPPKFANRPPVHPEKDKRLLEKNWQGAAGMADDIRYYGQWMREEAEKRIGHLYPKMKIDAEILKGRPDLEQQGLKVGDELTVIAWLWARTVKCPSPTCGARMPLVKSFLLSKKGTSNTWVEPVVEKADERNHISSLRFTIKRGEGEPPEGTVNRRGVRCIVCGTPVSFNHIGSEGKAGRMGAQMMAIVAEGKGGRVYLPPVKEHELIADVEKPQNIPENDLPQQALGFRVQGYGMKKYRDLFTNRQLTALTTISDLVLEARERIVQDARDAGLPGDEKGLDAGGIGATAYSDALSMYLTFAIDRIVDYSSTLCSWHTSGEKMSHTFTRQAISMIWDYAEANIFSNSTGNFPGAVDWIWKVIELSPCAASGSVMQLDAAASVKQVSNPLISTDPPYYDNIGYADLSDYFYIWLRRSLKDVFPGIFSTLLVPKNRELVAAPNRFNGDKKKAGDFFEAGLRSAFSNMRNSQHPNYPLTVYYAFKQSEPDEIMGEEYDEAIFSSGWESMLESLIKSGFSITGTWPIRTELSNRMRGISSNALVSSIVIACRSRAASAPMATRQEFIAALKAELPGALKNLRRGNIAPVDLAMAAIGPGMAVFSRYAKVIEADGTTISVRTAIQLINQLLDEYLSEQESEKGVGEEQ